MIVLDTNVVSELFRPEPDAGVVDRIDTLTGTVALTAVTVAELLAGVRRLDDSRRKVALAQAIGSIVEEYAARGSVLPFDAHAAEHYADIVTTRTRSGRPISTADAQMAAMCRSRGGACATRDTEDFVGTGVAVIDLWTLGVVD